MRVEILILIPRLDASGPARGALALHNGLRKLGVHSKIAPLKNCDFDHGVNTEVFLSNCTNFLQKIVELRKLIKSRDSEKVKIRIISICLQSDFLVYFARQRSLGISSVRGDLYKNYKDDLGLFGPILAWLHYKILSKFLLVTALNRYMYNQIKRYAKNISVIPNFIDETAFSMGTGKASGSFKFIFVGRLTRRKAIIETIEAFALLTENVPSIELHILGDGPLKDEVQEVIMKLQVSEKVIFHGFQKYPMNFLKSCDVFVLPSYSEGISRAAMEALFLGKRCIMQNVAGNAELIQSPKQGILIDDISQLDIAMREMLDAGRLPDEMRLPKQFRQIECVQGYIKEIYKKNN